MNQEIKWMLLMKKKTKEKSRASVPLRQETEEDKISVDMKLN
jgi:hypothetical protein